MPHSASLVLGLEPQSTTLVPESFPSVCVLLTFKTAEDATRFGNYVFDFQNKVFGNWNGAMIDRTQVQSGSRVQQLDVEVAHEYGVFTHLRLDPMYLQGEGEHNVLHNALWAFRQHWDGNTEQDVFASILHPSLVEQLENMAYDLPWPAVGEPGHHFKLKGLRIEPDSCRLVYVEEVTNTELLSDVLRNDLLVALQDGTPYDAIPVTEISMLEQLSELEEALGPKPMLPGEVRFDNLVKAGALIQVERKVDPSLVMPTVGPTAQPLTYDYLEELVSKMKPTGDTDSIKRLFNASDVKTDTHCYEVMGIGWLNKERFEQFDAAVKGVVKANGEGREFSFGNDFMGKAVVHEQPAQTSAHYLHAAVELGEMVEVKLSELYGDQKGPQQMLDAIETVMDVLNGFRSTILSEEVQAQGDLGHTTGVDLSRKYTNTYDEEVLRPYSHDTEQYEMPRPGSRAWIRLGNGQSANRTIDICIEYGCEYAKDMVQVIAYRCDTEEQSHREARFTLPCVGPVPE